MTRRAATAGGRRVRWSSSFHASPAPGFRAPRTSGRLGVAGYVSRHARTDRRIRSRHDPGRLPPRHRRGVPGADREDRCAGRRRTGGVPARAAAAHRDRALVPAGAGRVGRAGRTASCTRRTRSPRRFRCPARGRPSTRSAPGAAVCWSSHPRSAGWPGCTWTTSVSRSTSWPVTCSPSRRRPPCGSTARPTTSVTMWRTWWRRAAAGVPGIGVATGPCSSGRAARGRRGSGAGRPHRIPSGARRHDPASLGAVAAQVKQGFSGAYGSSEVVRHGQGIRLRHQ